MRFPILESWKTILVGIALAFSSAIFLNGTTYSEDGMSEWSERARLAIHSLVLDVAGTPDRLIAVGERGHVLLSSDGGTNWIQSLVPTRSMLNAITVVENHHSWIVGHDSVILHSSDSGKTWTRQSFDPQDDTPFFDVWFGGIKRGVAVGAYGLAVETYDGGKTWDRLAIANHDPHLYAITEDPKNNLYVVGEFGSIFRSRDLGKTWHVLDSSYEGTFFGILAHSNGTLLVFGLRGTILRSENGGENWRKIKTGTRASLFNGIERSDGTIVIVGSGGTILFSKDWGATFNKATRKNLSTIAAITEIGKGQLLMVGETGITHYNINTANGS